jgi:hypothetical protein
VFLSSVDFGLSLSLLPFRTGPLILGFVLPVWVWWLICVANVGVVDLCCGGFGG